MPPGLMRTNGARFPQVVPDELTMRSPSVIRPQSDGRSTPAKVTSVAPQDASWARPGKQARLADGDAADIGAADTIDKCKVASSVERGNDRECGLILAVIVFHSRFETNDRYALLDRTAC